MRKEFRRLVSIEEALSEIYKHFAPTPLGVEEIPLSSAHGRVLARDIQANIDVPPFDRSAMDGYAVRAADTVGADEWSPVVLKVKGRLEAGSSKLPEVGPREAVEVATGAPMPRAADAVVMVEYTEERGGDLMVYRPVRPGENVYRAGADIGFGEVVLYEGTLLGYKEIGILASLGYSRVPVYRRPVVAIISTGNELLEPGMPPEMGKVYDVNTYTLSYAVLESGGEPLPLGISKDDPEEIRKMIHRALSSADMVIASGSTSAGAGDVLYRLLDDIAGDEDPGVIIHGLKLKPGKPTVIAIIGGKLVYGLPGYPLSALMAYMKVVEPVLRALAGLGSRLLSRVEAELSFDLAVERGRRNLIPVSLIRRGGKLRAFPILKGSGAVRALSLADGFIEVPEDVGFLRSGEPVNVKLFSERTHMPSIYIIGSHCLGLELLLSQIDHPRDDYRVVSVGSLGGLMSIRRGEADVAGIHLLDGESGEYNVPFIVKLGLADKAVLVRGYLREQGLIIQKGNPKGIRGLRDLLRGDVVFVNRTRGSGTRTLLDLELSKIAAEEGVGFEEIASRIRGYSFESRTHTAVAYAVKVGRADVGLGTRAAAELYGLDFIPVGWEEYDFAVRRESLNSAFVEKFIQTLRSEKFRKRLAGELPGYRPLKDTGEIIPVR